MGRIYATKVDWWIAVTIAFTVIVLVASSVSLFMGPPGQKPLGWGIGILCLAIAVWIGWTPFNTTYQIVQTELVVRSAGFRWRIPLDCIVEVFPTRNPLSSPACSLDRLRVNYRRASGRLGFVLISPREHEQFIRDLAEAVPGLSVVGDRLMRSEENA